MPATDTDRVALVELEFHKQLSDLVNDWQRSAMAISVARDMAYAILNPEAKPEILQALAEYWLDHFGRTRGTS